MKIFSLFSAAVMLLFGSAFAQEVETIQKESTEISSVSITSDEAENTEGLILFCCGDCSGNDKDDK